MSGSPQFLAVEQGCELIEEAIWERHEAVREGVSELVEPFVSGLPNDPNPPFDSFARNLILGIDTAKASRSQPLQVARRTFAVSQLVICETLQRIPTFETGALIQQYVDAAHSREEGAIHMYNGLEMAFYRSTCFRAILMDCQPSIDPVASEPEVFRLFAGFALQAAALGESNRIRIEMEVGADLLQEFKGDLWDLFDD